MSFTGDPLVGAVNFLADPAAVITSDTLGAGSDIAHLTDPNLSAVTDLGVGTDTPIRIDFGSARAPNLLYVRFRDDGWQDLVDCDLRISANSDLSTPDLSTTITAQFPTVWPFWLPVRPHLVFSWTAVTARQYAGLDFARTAGIDPLRLAYLYLGEGLELKDGNGFRVYGSYLGAENHGSSVLSGLSSDIHLTGASRRVFGVKVEATHHDAVLDSWYPNLIYAGSMGTPVVYVQDPLETDSQRIQLYNTLGTVGIGQQLTVTAEHFDWWEHEIRIRERL